MTEAQTTVSWPILQRRSQGPQVKTLQYMLRGVRDLWQRVVVADGIFGPKTEDTVRGYQGLVGLTVDGIVGPLTWSSLTGNHGVIGHGAKGEFVKAAQNALDRHNYSLTIDGIFGDKTEAAARQFQQKVGLAVDGIVGPDTWRELITRKPD